MDIRRHRWLVLLLAAFLSVALLAAGCGGTQPEGGDGSETPAGEDGDTADTGEDGEGQPADGGVAALAIWSEPSNFNPLIFPTEYDSMVHDLLYNGLVQPNAQMEMEPDLAASWSFSNDGRTVTFTLKEGVTWHDGESFAADDVAFTLTSLADPRYAGGSYGIVEPIEGAPAFHNGEADSVAGIEVMGDNEIAITTAEPYAPLLSSLTVPIVPEHILSSVSPADWQTDVFNTETPVGTGPFQLDEYSAGSHIRMAAYDNYFGGAPHLDEVVFRIGDQDTMLAAFANDEVHHTRVPLESVSEYEDGVSGGEMVVSDQLSLQYLGLNLAKEDFASPQVRQAFAHAINKEQMVDSLMQGYGQTIDMPFPPSHWAYDDQFDGYAHDVERAQQLLEEAGWTDSNGDGTRDQNGTEMTYTLLYPTGNQVRERTAPLIQRDLENIGVGVELRAMEFGALINEALMPVDDSGDVRAPTAEDYDMFLLGYTFTSDPDEYRPYFHSEWAPPSGYNFNGYADPEMDMLLEENIRLMDFEERREMVRDIGRKLGRDLPWVPLYSQQRLVLVKDGLQGLQPDLRRITHNAEDWWLEE